MIGDIILLFFETGEGISCAFVHFLPSSFTILVVSLNHSAYRSLFSLRKTASSSLNAE